MTPSHISPTTHTGPMTKESHVLLPQSRSHISKLLEPVERSLGTLRLGSPLGPQGAPGGLSAPTASLNLRLCLPQAGTLSVRISPSVLMETRVDSGPTLSQGTGLGPPAAWPVPGLPPAVCQSARRDTPCHLLSQPGPSGFLSELAVYRRPCWEGCCPCSVSVLSPLSLAVWPGSHGPLLSEEVSCKTRWRGGKLSSISGVRNTSQADPCCPADKKCSRSSENSRTLGQDLAARAGGW